MWDHYLFRYRYVLGSKEELLKELNFLEEHIGSLTMPVVFSHGDWRNENIIYNQVNGNADSDDGFSPFTQYIVIFNYYRLTLFRR